MVKTGERHHRTVISWTCRAYIQRVLMSIFDKSFIHSITVDEATVFDMHFMSNLTPLFFVEVLADLEKSGMTDDSRAGLVRDLASKTPMMHSYSNIPHAILAASELLGQPIEMRGAPLVGGGRRVQSSEGLGTVVEHPPEMKAAQRWQDGEFGPEEYASACAWREMLVRARESVATFLSGRTERFAFWDLAAVKRFAEKIVDGDGRRYRTLRSALVMIGLPEEMHSRVVRRWKDAGGPRLAEFAPYARHVLLVDIFRTLSMAGGLLSPDKTSNFADIAYLYYLPFCQVFISSDKLHRKCVPLFLTEKQQFVWGYDLRPHLTALATEYLNDPALPEVGLFKLANRKRFEPRSFIGEILVRGGFVSRTGEPHETSFEDRLSPEAEKALVEKLTRAAEAPPPNQDADLSEEDVNMTIVRSIPMRRGRFPMMPKGVKATE